MRRYNRFAAVTNSDTDAIPTGLTDALYIGTAGVSGTLVAVKSNGDLLTMVGLTAGTLLPIQVTRVDATTTTVSDVVALYEV